ncbi:gamma-glutamyltransferase [Mesorhizobium sp.]|uniref:gamma-glutamyltransferase n=1 Tax=Mesorhizobium sp. TaxID=1871066 RepID=UPI000FE38C8C|nr:gamma-glutamyltransferase [Mesorhizobium sp.]RWQ12606.1 MAG: hypothetical protein EOR92_33490 [Mesorhizobium sp.]
MACRGCSPIGGTGWRASAAGGSNAFDAAVATAAALNVVEPFMSGFAGLGLATAWVAAEERVRVLDFVTRIPASFPEGRFTQRSELERGANAVSPPAGLAGWCELVERYGRMSLAEVFAPAISLAMDGFALSEFGADQFNEQLLLLPEWPELHASVSNNYARGSGTASVGTLIRQRELAQTLTDISMWSFI